MFISHADNIQIPEVLQTQSLDLSSSSSITTSPKGEDCIDVNPYRSVQLSNENFKRVKSITSQPEQAIPDTPQLSLKRENHRLQRELENKEKQHALEINILKESLLKEHAQHIKALEEEHAILIDGVRQECREQIAYLKEHIDAKETESKCITQKCLSQLVEIDKLNEQVSIMQNEIL